MSEPAKQEPKSRLVDLQIKKRLNWGWNKRLSHHYIKQSLPFSFNHNSGYVHRVRSGMVHLFDGDATHTSISYWCGGTAFFGGKKKRSCELLAEVPEEAVICATCEGRAIGAGVVGNGEINGRAVVFQPRPPLEGAE